MSIVIIIKKEASGFIASRSHNTAYPWRPNIQALDLRVVLDTLHETLASGSTSFPATEWQIPAASRSCTVDAYHATLQLLSNSDRALEILRIKGSVQTELCVIRFGNGF